MEPCPINHHVWPNVCQCEGDDRSRCPTHHPHPEGLRCQICGASVLELTSGAVASNNTTGYRWGQSITEMLNAAPDNSGGSGRTQVGINNATYFTDNAASNIAPRGINQDHLDRVHRFLTEIEEAIPPDTPPPDMPPMDENLDPDHPADLGRLLAARDVIESRHLTEGATLSLDGGNTFVVARDVADRLRNYRDQVNVQPLAWEPRIVDGDS